MIAKINTGSNFGTTFKYLLNPKKQPRHIGGNVAEKTIGELTEEFNFAAQARLSTQKPVKHIAVAFAPEDGEISDEIKYAIADAIVEGLGYTNNQYVVIDHHRDDPGHHWVHDHDHIHIVVNSIAMDGARTPDSFETYRVQEIARKLEAQYNLVQLQSSWEVSQRRPTHGQVQRYKKEKREYEEGKRDEPPKVIASQYIQEAIATASNDKPTFSEFVHRLQEQGVEVYPKLVKGRTLPLGFSYTYEGVKIPGYKLKGSSFRKLLGDRGVRFSPLRDIPVLEEALQRSIPAMEKYERAEATTPNPQTAAQTSPTATAAKVATAAAATPATTKQTAMTAKVATEPTTTPATATTTAAATPTTAAAAEASPPAAATPMVTAATAAAGKSRTRQPKQEEEQPEPAPPPPQQPKPRKKKQMEL